MKLLVVLGLILSISGFAFAAHPFQVEDMQKISRIADPQLSPDGKWVAFMVQKSDVAQNKAVRNLWIMPSTGGDPHQLTFAEKGSNSQPRWSPDSTSLYFISDRASDVPQIFQLNLAGGEAKQVTKFSMGVDSFILSPDGKTLAISTGVFPECSDLACNEKKQKEVDDNKVKVRVINTIPFRRWDSWVEGKRNHIFVMPAAGSDARDITPGDVDSPIWSEAGGEEVAFSPDSQEIAFSRYTGNEALDGDSNLFTIPVSGGTPKQITDNKGVDTTPVYSPDGRYIAYSSGTRPGTEYDLTRIFLYDRKSGDHINLTADLDRSMQSYVWSADSKTLWTTMEEAGESHIYKLDVASKQRTRIYDQATSYGLQSLHDQALIFSWMDISHPVELYKIDLKTNAKPVQLTHMNDALLKDIEMGEYSPITVKGWNNDPVQVWQIKPPGFDPAKKYPLLLLMHGGPEGAWDNLFHYRWNPQLFAAAGYVVIEPNFHGSTGFGLKFTDAIKGQWGGAPYEDQMKAVDTALTWPYVDSTRIAAAGASYGGYMANWVEGHTDRFRAIVSHDGLYDLLSSLYDSDLVGGIDKEFKGTVTENQQTLIDNAPVTFAKNFKTPMLVIHGERDYRVEISSGYAMFQVLQSMHVPSKFIVFKEENHFVLKPADNIFWYHTVLDWLDHWVKPDTNQYRTMMSAGGSQ